MSLVPRNIEYILAFTDISHSISASQATMFGLLFLASIVLQQFESSVHAEEINQKHCPRNLDIDITQYSLHEKGSFRQQGRRE